MPALPGYVGPTRTEVHPDAGPPGSRLSNSLRWQKSSTANTLLDARQRLRGFCSLPARAPSGIPSLGIGGLFVANICAQGLRLPLRKPRATPP
jgi:hypothetical protein